MNKEEELKQEIEKLKTERNQIATVNNSLIMAIVSTIPFKGEIGGSNISVIDQLHKLIDSFYLLKEIRKKIKLGKITSYCDYRDIDKKLDEVLGNDI